MKYHIHDYSDWKDIGAIDTFTYSGGAILQTRKCVVCGKRQLRRTNSVTSSVPSQVTGLLSTMLRGGK